MFRSMKFVAVVLLFCGAVQAQEGLLLAAGAGYRKPVLELTALFTTRHGVKADASFGNMKQIETQARQNPEVALLIGDQMFLEPMDLFERYVPLGRGRLALAAARGVELKELSDLREPRFRRIAVPDRKQAVYGRAAFACMERRGIAAALAEKLLEVATVPQVSAYVSTGEVDAGFVNTTEAQTLGARAGEILELPENCHDPILISAGLVRGRADTPAVRAFVDFLGSTEARALLARHGL